MKVEAAAEAAARVVMVEAALAEVQAEHNAAGSDDEQLRRDFDRMVEAAVAVREEVRTAAEISLLLLDCEAEGESTNS